MARGGKRPGAGRKPGSATKKTRQIANHVVAASQARAADQAKAQGAATTAQVPNAATMTPLEVMLDNMRHFFQVALDAEATLDGMTALELTGVEMEPDAQFKLLLAEVKKTVGFRQLAQDAAKDAARFIHPALAAVEAKRGDESEEVVPLHERLAAYARKDAIADSAGKVIDIKRKAQA